MFTPLLSHTARCTLCVCEVSSVCHTLLSPLCNLQHNVNNRDVWKRSLYHLVLSEQSCQSYSLLRPLKAQNCCNHKSQGFYSDSGRSRIHFTFMLHFLCHK